jgi:hypothetical protein
VVNAIQEFNASQNVVRLLTFNAEFETFLSADRDKHSIILGADVVERDVLTNARVALQLHAQIENILDFLLDDVGRESIPRDTPKQHTAWLVGGLEDGNRISPPGELVGT